MGLNELPLPTYLKKTDNYTNRWYRIIQIIFIYTDSVTVKLVLGALPKTNF